MTAGALSRAAVDRGVSLFLAPRKHSNELSLALERISR
jgi:hypothetical protein